VLAKELREEHKIVQQYAGQLQKKGIEAVGLLIAGATITTLLNEMKKLEIDLLIIGHHKHGFFYKIFGEVTDIPLMKKSKVPVLMVPLSDDE
jgi:nucleotide-binding universal stress UspA family protein